jgi:hypothetical protein
MKPAAACFQASILIVACLFVTQNLYADIQAIGLQEDRTVPPTAEARQEIWVNSLQQFNQMHRDLPDAKARLIELAIENTEPGLFPDNPDAETKAKLAFTLLTLRSNLSAGQFREILTGFKGLHSWLLENQVLPPEGDCNCSGTCAGGFSCQSVGCLSPKGTVNYGVCS